MISTKEKGITLIALIITIIVMLILVAVTVNVALNGGLFDQAKKAKYQTEVSVIKDFLTEKSATLIAENPNNDVLSGLTSLEQLDIDQDLKDKYKDKLEIHDGVLYYNPEVVTNAKERQWLEQIDVYPYEGGNPVDPDAPKATLKVGDYVDYKSAMTEAGYDANIAAIVNRNESGTDYLKDHADQGFQPDLYSTPNGAWRVFNIDEETGKILLVSATASTPQSINETKGNGSLVLKDEQVYNNGVEILNRVCDELYTVNGLGKARSINIEDIYSVLDKELPKLSSFTINASANINSKEYDNSYYPIKATNEIGTVIDGEIVNTGLSSFSQIGKIYLNDSKIYTYYTQEENTSGIDKDKTYKQFTNTLKLMDTTPLVTNINTSINSLTDETLKEVILGKDETRPWWIATRSIIQDSNRGAYYAGFGMMRVNNGKTVEQKADFWTIDYSGVTTRTNVCDYNYGSTIGQLNGYFRPVIELDASKIIDTTITDTTDGSFEHPWKIK